MNFKIFTFGIACIFFLSACGKDNKALSEHDRLLNAAADIVCAGQDITQKAGVNPLKISEMDTDQQMAMKREMDERTEIIAKKNGFPSAEAMNTAGMAMSNKNQEEERKNSDRVLQLAKEKCAFNPTKMVGQ